MSPNTRYHICVIGTGNWLSEPLANALQRLHYNESRDDLLLGMTAVGDVPLAAALPSMPDSYSPYQHMNGAIHEQQQQALIENSIVTDKALHEVLKNSHISACTDVQTLDSTPSLITDENGLSSNGFIHSILTRRLGLIVGCCLGIIVFIVMISVLSYVKLKKQRIENAKRQAAMPPEYISYRHFSIPNEELTRTAASVNSAAAAAAAASAATVSAGGAHGMASVPSGISAHISGTSLSTGTTTTTATTPIGGIPLAMAKSGSRSPIVGIAGLVVENGDAAGSIVAVATSPASNAPHNNHSHNNHHQAAHRPNNGAIGGYMAAGVVLNTNHLSVC